MRLHPELWQRYFDDFLQHKLQLKGLHGGGISQRLRHVLFQQLNKQDAISCVVSLHCYSHVDLAKMADLLRPLNQIQVGRCIEDVHLCPCVHALHRKATFSVLQTTTIEFPLPASTPDGEHLAKATQTHNFLGTPECIATFVVNTLFAAIVEATNVSVTTVPEKMTVWFKAYRYYTHMYTPSYTLRTPIHALPFFIHIHKGYRFLCNSLKFLCTHRDLMTLSTVKKSVYEPLGSEARGLWMVVEAKLNVMQAVFLTIQTSPSLEEDILQKGLHIFQTLLNEYFTTTLKVPM